MSGFDTRWLDLREPADIAARDMTLAANAIAHVESLERPQILDIGCGTGATFRALDPLFGERPAWRLLDHDVALIGEARRRIGMHARVMFETGDLARIDTIALPERGLVTASALFDLVSADFVDRFTDRLAKAGIGLYAALNYDGRIAWTPGIAGDEQVVAAFNRHQTHDKGFGTALGPNAGEALAEALRERGFRVSTAQAPWRMDAGEAPLHRAFVEGIAGALAETGDVPPDALRDWGRARGAAGGSCLVGHVDVLALPD